MACGGPFPWTETALRAARVATDEAEGISAEDQATLKETFEDLTKNTLNTPLAESRFKRILKTAGPAALQVVTNTLTSVLTSEAKSRLGI